MSYIVNSSEILQTIEMINQQHLDVRTVTMGISLLDCADSDIDLAVIASPGWDGRRDLEDAVRTSVGNGCDVLVFTPDQFQQLAGSGEPVVSDILRDGLALIGSMPRTRDGAA